MIEGTTLLLGSIVFLGYTAGHLLIDQPGIIGVFLLVLVLNFIVAGMLGLWLRSCNLTVRGCAVAHLSHMKSFYCF